MSEDDVPRFAGRVALDRQGEPFQVRLYAPGDRDSLEAFYDGFEPQRAAQGLPPTGLDRIRRWLDSILPTGEHLLVLRGDAVLGHAFLAPTARRETVEYAIFLHQDVRGRGMGSAVTAAAVDVARERGYARVWLTVQPRNRAAIRTYERAGFRFRPSTIYSPEAEMELHLE